MDGDPIATYIHFIVQAEQELIEQTFEEAVQGGKYGVKIIRRRIGGLILCEVNESVPYGQIYEFLVD